MLQPLLRGFLEDFLRNEEKHGNGYMPVRAGGGLPTGDFGVGAGPGVALHSLRSPNLKPSEGRGWSHRYWCTEVVTPGLSGSENSYSPGLRLDLPLASLAH